jgi:NADPH:quinone reductase-like Zn-dependent oxidoreductase
MKAIFLVKNGSANNAFELREIAEPKPGTGQVLIKVNAFGLNFADVMARRGMYKEAPPLPCVLGYDVAGTVAEIGAGVTHVKVGDRVTAMTRFGGYAEFALTDASAVAIIPNFIDDATATALTTQYCTAYYAAGEMVNLHEGDRVLIHAGAGGVGRALIQFAKYKNCEIFSTAGSAEKLASLSALGVNHPINYSTEDFASKIKELTAGRGVDVIFDAVGGASVKKGFNSLAAGGRIICYGASAMNNTNIFGKISAAVGFGFYHPVMLMMPSKSIIGINMLKIADNKPQVIQRCLAAVMDFTLKKIFTPLPATAFPYTEVAQAHDYLEGRRSMGKVAVTW